MQKENKTKKNGAKWNEKFLPLATDDWPSALNIKKMENIFVIENFIKFIEKHNKRKWIWTMQMAATNREFSVKKTAIERWTDRINDANEPSYD